MLTTGKIESEIYFTTGFKIENLDVFLNLFLTKKVEGGCV